MRGHDRCAAIQGYVNPPVAWWAENMLPKAGSFCFIKKIQKGFICLCIVQKVFTDIILTNPGILLLKFNLMMIAPNSLVRQKEGGQERKPLCCLVDRKFVAQNG